MVRVAKNEAQVVDELVDTLLRLAREDRELYRQLRSEAWALSAKAHGKQTEEERAAWLAVAS